MGTKEKILELFEGNKGVYFSGEDIAERLSVSRTAVWKAVKSLRGEGYRIDAVQNRGYCLSVRSDILSAQGIKKYLDPGIKDLELTVLADVDSTNSLLREKAAMGAPEGCTVISNRQSRGRGRTGKEFFSPRDTGIYLSVLLRPRHCAARQAAGITTMAAAAACEAIEAVSGERTEIKWVNDIYMRGKKVSGILTEAVLGLEDGMLEYAVLGIGINVYPPRDGFPEELRESAGAVFQEPQDDGKNCLAAGFLNRFMGYYLSGESRDYAEQYRARSMVIGREIWVLSPEGRRAAAAVDVDEECRLLVEYEDGSRERLSSGEISVRLGEQDWRRDAETGSRSRN